MRMCDPSTSASILLRRLRTPHIIGLILAGVMIGQHGFNIIERDRSFEIFGQVGIYFIMFLAALEMNMGSVHQYGRKGFLFGMITYCVPFALGFLRSGPAMKRSGCQRRARFR